MAPRTVINEQDIGRVRDRLDRAIATLIERGPAPTGVDQLREAARLLEEIRQAAASQPPTPTLAAALGDLAARVARAGELLDSAAAFYRGWWQASPPPPEDYTAEGAWASAAVRASTAGGLSLEA